MQAGVIDLSEWELLVPDPTLEVRGKGNMRALVETGTNKVKLKYRKKNHDRRIITPRRGSKQ